MEREAPEFIFLLLSPSNSPDSNPVDDSMCSILQEKVHKTRTTDFNDLKHCIRTKWASWITPSLLQLCISGVVVFQLVSGQAVVISSTAFNSDIVFCDKCGLWSFLWLVKSNSCKLIFRFDFIAVVCYGNVHFNSWRSFNSQSKVMSS